MPVVCTHHVTDTQDLLFLKTRLLNTHHIVNRTLLDIVLFNTFRRF
jgi:hypothetical protein